MVKVLNRIQPAHIGHITTLLCACHNPHLMFLFVHIQNGKTPLDSARDRDWRTLRGQTRRRRGLRGVIKFLQEKLGKCILISTLRVLALHYVKYAVMQLTLYRDTYYMCIQLHEYSLHTLLLEHVHQISLQTLVYRNKIPVHVLCMCI